MSKRDAFWKSIWLADGETVAWPSEASERGQLASRIAGAAVVGAAEHVLGESLDRLAGQRPAPGSENYEARNRDAQVLSTLSDEQRGAVTRLVRETAYFSVYWPMVKMRNPPGIAVRLVAARCGEDDASEETFDLTDFLDPHQLLLQWVDEFGEFVDPQAPLDARWNDALLRGAEPKATE